ncbi:MAG: hypothetical protein H0T73_16115 [Ardenticatenales bacterium]|nr:hypothetical protein [Ardenticatenales bacterium]
MARRSRTLGLSAYFHHTAFDLNLNEIRENRSRGYLEHRLAQVDIWLFHLAKQLRHPPIREPRPGSFSTDSIEANHLMDFAYLHAVRQAIYETLNTL